MDIDGHFYAVLVLARARGFRKEVAHEIAYASQFVDDAKLNLVELHGPVAQGVKTVKIDGKETLFGMATCHSYTRLATFNFSAMVENTCAFHFVPGGQGTCFPKRMRCSPGSPVMRGILADVASQRDPIALGVALHACADTFAHQGFSGLLCKVNDIDNLRVQPRTARAADFASFFGKGLRRRLSRLFDWLLPAYGHAQAAKFPDTPYLTWSYTYDQSDCFADVPGASGWIPNPERYGGAVNQITGVLDAYMAEHPEFADQGVPPQNRAMLTAGVVRELTARASLSSRKRRLKAMMVELGLVSPAEISRLDYDPDAWLHEAFPRISRRALRRRSVRDATVGPGFVNCHWHRFCRAVAWYKERFFHYCTANNLSIPH